MSLDFELLVGQNKQCEDITLDLGLTILYNKTINWSFKRIINEENNYVAIINHTLGL